MQLRNLAASAGVCLVIVLIMQDSAAATPLEEWMAKLNDGKSAQARKFRVTVKEKAYTAAIGVAESLEGGTKIKIPYTLDSTMFRQDIMLTATAVYGAFFKSEPVAEEVAKTLTGVITSADVRGAATEVIRKMSIIMDLIKDPRLQGPPHFQELNGAVVSMGMSKK